MKTIISLLLICVITKSYTIYSDRVKDLSYKAQAYSPDGTKIFSPIIPKYRKTVDISKVYTGNWFTPTDGISNKDSAKTLHNILIA